ncbi:DNA cytosine methyltransferase [Caballeronia zhejiangensis]|uniref:DNA cytosine methyltransferase n=1 Tax=Caballeronia zhejiangensis TaxID=871203 RepID=UPI00158C582B|nr:DNA cytosine methyltransferase [Caballeronia zhejiangensis]
MARAYYNEIDKNAAQWLRNLIAAGHIAPGDVDDRSIEDVRPDDLRGYTQCHFFAGIGVWSYALRRAGWADDSEVWTMSCPCQPFSAAGKGGGFDDERHLWPAAHWLIEQRRPAIIFGEQVSSKDAEPWLDLVSADLEGLGFAFGSFAFPSAGVGAPHIRDRTYFVAHAAQRGRRKERAHARGFDAGDRAQGLATGSFDGGMSRRVADSDCERLGGLDPLLLGIQAGRVACDLAEAAGRREAGELADAYGRKRDGLAVIRRSERNGQDAGRPQGRSQPQSRREPNHLVIVDADTGVTAGPTNGFWRDADWLLCRDEKFRPVEPGTFPLVDGAPARVVRLRAYGNAINAEAACAFIEAADEALGEYDLI